jgi:hypothetical protein
MLNDETRLDYLHRERLAVLRSLLQSNLEEKALRACKESSVFHKRCKIAEIKSVTRVIQIWLRDIEQREGSLRFSRW